LSRAYEQIRPYGFLLLRVCMSLGVFRVVLLPVLGAVHYMLRI